jgi:sugar lactone lactonase YvrE
MNIRTRSSRVLLVAALAAVALTGPSLASGAQAEERPGTVVPGQPVVVPLGVGTRPESVTRAWGGKFYVSIQNKPDLGVLDGEVRIVDLDAGTTTPFVQGLENPRGIAFTGRFLVVTDTTVIWIIDRSGAKRKLAEAGAFPHPAAFFNDAEPTRDGKGVYVSEMGGRAVMRDPATGLLWPTDSPQALAIPSTSRIYRISLTGQIKEVVPPSRRHLVMNGVTQARDDHLLVADMFYGNLVEVDLRTNRNLVIASGFRAADGIAQGRDGTVFVASFDNGGIWRMDADGENPKVLASGFGRGSTADLYLDEKAKRVLVPDTLHGTIVIVSTQAP